MNPRTRSLRVAIVDDEQPARELLRQLLEQDESVEIVAECANGFEAVKAVAEQRPDLVLLDIQMPKLNGFEVLELLDPVPAVVFTTAFDEYALKAFEVHAVDYLLKPISGERLHEAVARARQSTTPAPAAELAAAARPPGQWAARILVREGQRVRVLQTTQVAFLEARDDQVRIRSEGEDFLKAATLGSLLEQLDPALFVRVHRSCALNLAFLDKVELYAKDSRVAILRDGARLPVSRAGYARLRERLQ